MMTESAIFIGQNGSMGFLFGVRYTLDIEIVNHRIWVHCGMKSCPYAILSALQKNWDFRKA